MYNVSRMQAEMNPPPEGPEADLTCPNTDWQPLHLLKNPVTLPCCPQTVLCRTCAGKSILMNGKQCYQCGKTAGLSDLISSIETRSRLQALRERKAEEQEQETAPPRWGPITLEPTGTADNDSGSESGSDSIHTLGNAADAVDQRLAEYTRNYEEDHREMLLITPTNFKDPTPFPHKRFIQIYGGLGIHAIVYPMETNMEIPDGRLFSKWNPTQGPWTPYRDDRQMKPDTKIWRWLEQETPPKPITCARRFRTRDNEYLWRTGDTEKDYNGRGLPQIQYTDQDPRGAYIMANELVPGLSPVLMGKRDGQGKIWWQTTDKVTHKTHQIWLAGWTQPGSHAFKSLVDFTIQHWPREDLVGPTGGPGKVRIIVARGPGEPGTEYDPSLLTTTDSSGEEDDEKGLTRGQIRRRHRLIKSRRSAMEARRRDRDGMPIAEWLLGRFPNQPTLQTAPIVTASQPLHKSRVWLEDIETKRQTLHRTFLPWYPNLKDWLLMGRSPDPTAINNAYEECDFENWRWMRHNDGEGNMWLAGYKHRSGPRQGRITKTYRTLKALTFVTYSPDDQRPDEEIRDERIATLQVVARQLGKPMLACSSVYRVEDHNMIVHGMGWHDWSETKRKCYRACYRWRCATTWDLDMEPIRPFRSWPEVISFINGFLGGFYETEIQTLQQNRDYRPEADKPRQWWPHMFPQDCRRAKMHMAATAARTIDDLIKNTRKRTSKEPDAVEKKDRLRAWWWVRRRDYVRPTPPKQYHRPGIWKEWSLTPHPDAWDGWTRHEEKPTRVRRIHE